MIVNGIPYFGGRGVVGTLLFGDGSAAAPSISFLNNPDTGFFRDTVDQIAISCGGAKRGYLTFASLGLGIYGNGGGNLVLGSAGAVELTAAGTNQNITVSPSGTGHFVVSGKQSTFGDTVNFQTASGGGGRLTWGITSFQIYGGTGFPDIALLPIGSGKVLVGTSTNSGNGMLQLATHTTAPGGIGFGTDTSLHRLAAGILRLDASNGVGFSFISSNYQTIAIHQGDTPGTVADSPSVVVQSASGGGFLRLATNGGTTALTLDSAQRAIFAGPIRLNNAAVAGAVVPTHTVTIQDVTGTTWRVPVLI